MEFLQILKCLKFYIQAVSWDFIRAFPRASLNKKYKPVEIDFGDYPEQTERQIFKYFIFV